MNFPQTKTIKDLDRKHEIWLKYSADWERMNLLYSGGCDIKKEAHQFLVRRPKELEDVYKARIERFVYANHVGTATDWYLAAQFEKPPRIDASESAAVPSASKGFYEKFLKDCNRSGTAFVDLFVSVFKHILVYGTSYILCDLPTRSQEYANAAEERASGQLDPYACIYDPRQAINWEKDSYGNLKWIVFTVRKIESVPLGAAQTYDYWYFFDQENYAVYRRLVPEGETKTPDDGVAELYGNPGRHGRADAKKVPVICVDVPEGMWLMNRAYLSSVDHLNTDNVLSWSLQMAALAMPVIMSDSQVDITLSEAGFIHLPKDSSYSWTEPEGKSFGNLADRTKSLVEHIFRAYYLIAQSRTNEATPAAQSAVSKQQDMAPSKKTLNLFGDILRKAMQSTLNCVSEMRDDSVEWIVSGFEFEDEPVDEDLKATSTALSLSVPSLTFEHELYKKVVVMLFPDMDPELRNKIVSEIESADSREERLQKLVEKSASAVTSKFGKAVSQT